MKQNNYSAKLKAEVMLEAISSLKTIQQTEQERGRHPESITSWVKAKSKMVATCPAKLDPEPYTSFLGYGSGQRRDAGGGGGLAKSRKVDNLLECVV